MEVQEEREKEEEVGRREISRWRGSRKETKRYKKGGNGRERKMWLIYELYNESWFKRILEFEANFRRQISAGDLYTFLGLNSQESSRPLIPCRLEVYWSQTDSKIYFLPLSDREELRHFCCTCPCFSLSLTLSEINVFAVKWDCELFKHREKY